MRQLPDGTEARCDGCGTWVFCSHLTPASQDEPDKKLGECVAGGAPYKTSGGHPIKRAGSWCSDHTGFPFDASRRDREIAATSRRIVAAVVKEAEKRSTLQEGQCPVDG